MWLCSGCGHRAPEQARLGVVVGEGLGRMRAASARRRARRSCGSRAPGSRAGRPGSSELRLVVDAALRHAASACGRRAGSCATGTRPVDRDLVEVRPAQADELRVHGRRTAGPAAADRCVKSMPGHDVGRDGTRPARSRRRSCPGCGRAPCGRSASAARSPRGSAWSRRGCRRRSLSAVSSVEQLDAELPFREVAGVDRLEQVAAMEVGIGAGDLHRLVPDRRLQRRASAASGTSRRSTRPWR